MVAQVNKQLANLEYTDGANGSLKESSSNFHWVTITSITENKKSGDVHVQVSTWGGKATIDLKDLWHDPKSYKRLIYFDSENK